MKLKRCVYCGGNDHPAECGYQDVTPFPWLGIVLFLVLPVIVALIGWVLS